MASITFLVLERGSVYQGIGFGAKAPTANDLEPGVFVYRTTGEIVFNTAHSGYYEALTDPSYSGQILAMTYPHMGNYGTDPVWNESSIETGRTARPIKAAGFVVRSVYRGPVGEGRGDFSDWLEKNGIPGISEVDTRRLTLELRDGGSQKGVLVQAADGTSLTAAELETIKKYLAAFPNMVGLNLIGEVGTARFETIPGTGAKHVAVIDYGAKDNILRELKRRGCTISLFPSDATAAEVLAVKPDGVLLTNGPGDPAVLIPQIKTIVDLLGKLPITGICLGHQLLGHALGGKTYKMKFGHHGVNHPVRDEFSKKVFVTSQNHGFAVDEKSLPSDVKVWFRNANDQSVEGLVSEKRRVRCVQFHPESAPGPLDSLWIFDTFLADMKKA